MAQDYDARDSGDLNGDEADDYFVDPYPLVSLELPPPHLEALKHMLDRITPQDEFEEEIRTTLLNFHPEVELNEIRELAEFRAVLDQFADVGGEYDA
jgi:hypothetical protein